jgi:hypothetical protein
MNLLPFPASKDENLPPKRKELVRCGAELAGMAEEDGRLAGFEERLQGDIAKAIAAEGEFEAAVKHDAQALLDRLRGGLDGIWGGVGRKARQAAGALIEVHADKSVAQRALDAVIRERGANRGRAQELEQRKQALINNVTVEAIGAGLKAELSEALETARIALTRLEALHRAVNPPPVEYIPARRAAITIDASQADDVELVIEGREVDKSLSIILEFKAALERDALVKAPGFPDLDYSIDEDVVYHDLRLSEQRARAADPHFAPKITRNARTAV